MENIPAEETNIQKFNYKTNKQTNRQTDKKKHKKKRFPNLIFLMEKWSESWLKESLNIHTTYLRTQLNLVGIYT